ncbi:MAG TPA: HAD-IB family phosphatase [Alphaproteobacteria bacterium]|nr:HAD-IB family phosphatase [Alphaproteobacteria bacterium]
MPKKVNVVLFDFDGTLSAKDSTPEFFKYCFKHSLRPWLFIPFILFGLIIKKFNSSGVWWRQITRLFINANMVKKLAPGFIKQHKLNRFGWAAERVAAERAAGNKVILISAGADYLITKLVNDIKFDAIFASEMDPAKPWKYKYFPYGKNKVVVLKKWAKKNKVTPNVVRAYSDSKSDIPMMNLAQEQVWINPKTGARIEK